MIQPTVFLLDVDGVLTTGHFFYTLDGKMMKEFGPDDHDALLLLKPHLDIHFITGDRKGFPISEKRIVVDMKMKLDLVSTFERITWIQQHCDPQTTIYMGDGIFDHLVFNQVGYSIATSDAYYETKQKATFVTQSKGGNRAVAEACLHILKTFFPEHKNEMVKLKKGEGEWGL